MKKTVEINETINLSNQHLMALDYGQKFIGVALFYVGRDPFPTPYERIENKNFPYIVKNIQRIIEEEFIDLLIIGVPYLLDGGTTQTTLKVEKFIEELRPQISIPIFEQDETLSTYEAENRMKNSPLYNFKVDLKKIDSLSASIILEDFMVRYK